MDSSGKTADSRLKKVAAGIDRLADKDAASVRYEREIGRLRAEGAVELHRTCSDFVSDLNSLLSNAIVRLDPPQYSAEAFADNGMNLFQMNIQGRLLQIAFEATPGLLSTEDFRIPYTLEGSVRAFNQQLLDRNAVEEQMLFYTVERHEGVWRYFDSRTHRSARFDREYLIGLIEALI